MTRVTKDFGAGSEVFFGPKPKPQTPKAPIPKAASEPQSPKAYTPKKTSLPAPKSFVTRVILVQGTPETPTLCVLCRGPEKPEDNGGGGGGGVRGLIRLIRVSGGAFVYERRLIGLNRA